MSATNPIVKVCASSMELKRGAEAQIVLNQLYKHTDMQTGFSMIFLAVVNNQPKEMGLVEAIQHFINHRIDVVRRRTAFLLQKAKDREHILEGYRLALDHLDNVIVIIRGSADRASARENLVNYFAGRKIDINVTGKAPKLDPEKPCSPKQADAILELQLHRLTRLSIDEIIKELTSIKDEIAEYEFILGSEAKLRRVIVKELEEVKKQYGDARRTQIVDETTEIQLEDLIVDEQVAVTISHNGYLKRTAITTYRSQRRGGTGRKGMSTREEDFVEKLYSYPLRTITCWYSPTPDASTGSRFTRFPTSALPARASTSATSLPCSRVRPSRPSCRCAISKPRTNMSSSSPAWAR